MAIDVQLELDLQPSGTLLILRRGRVRNRVRWYRGCSIVTGLGEFILDVGERQGMFDESVIVGKLSPVRETDEFRG